MTHINAHVLKLGVQVVQSHAGVRADKIAGIKAARIGFVAAGGRGQHGELAVSEIRHRSADGDQADNDRPARRGFVALVERAVRGGCQVWGPHTSW